MSLIYQTKNVGSGDVFSIYSDSASSISIQKIKNYINSNVIRPRFRVFWLNQDETVKTVLPEKDILSGSYSENYQNGQRRSLSLELYNEDGRYTPNINGIWQDVKFSLYIGLELDDETILWFSKGIYYILNASVSHGVGQKTVSVDLGDKYSILESSLGTLETSYTIDAGILIKDVVDDILRKSKGNGEILDPKEIVYDPSFYYKKTQAKIVKEAGSNFGAIIIELATQLSAEVFYDVDGHLNFVPISDVTKDRDKPIIFQIYDYYGDFSSNNISLNLGDAVNRIVVTGSNVNGGIVEATAINDNPESPLCYQRIGYRTAPVINDTNITSEVLAQERANYELRNKLILKSSINVDVVFNPLLTVNNLIGVTDEYYEMEQESFLIQSISYSIGDNGMMSISCSNIVNLPFLT